MKIKVIALALAILAFFIFVGSPFQQAAQAVVGVSTGLIAIIIAFLAAMGITFTTTGVFDTMEDYVGSLLEDWAVTTGNSLIYNLSGVNYGRNKLGQIVVNNRFIRMIQAFATYLKARFGVVDNTTHPLVVAGTAINGYMSYALPVAVYADIFGSGSIYEYLNEEYQVDNDIFAIPTYDSKFDSLRWVFWSLSPGSVTTKEINPNGNVTTLTPDALALRSSGIYATNNRYAHKIDQVTGLDYTIQGDLNTIIESIYNGQPTITYEGNEINLEAGTIVLPDDDENYNPGDGAILDVGAPWGESLEDIVTETIPENYMDSDITYTGEESATEQYVEDDTLTEINSNPGDYQVTGLTSVFPFCIPFDIYSFFECLAAEPVAPSFEWRFYVPRICDETIVLDLSQFDTVAQIVRTMELLAFIVGLAFVTRDKMIKG